MASSSSSATSSDHNKKRYQYDVFLSFSGEDTRRSFVDHLNNALQGYGIRTFKDDERLRKGKEIKDDLLKSIEDSRICIIVFSKKYASSSWCLDELVKIMECQRTPDQIAIPVFYDVEPTEVRKQSGSVGEAFAKHNNKVVAWKPLTKTVLEKAHARHTNKKLGKWRKALKDAANLCGWELKNTAQGFHLYIFDGTLCDSDPLHRTNYAFCDMLKEIGFNGKHNEELWSALLSDWELEKAIKFIVDQEALFRR
ncbi:putative TIR domain-containing protein [Helianthus annuus]|nr:putative TIR domain-containing protein [Helianthus annuus]